ncbi:toxin glutamine deamidase domain-containing protein [Kitasatospora saccharophila]|uniref:toxin glutamine deamidase domain-containing protein n=1 Tax=Kitasatospora saccharophila TaxID=407973 RepID=UPI00363A207C
MDGTDLPSNHEETVSHVEPEPLPPVGTPEHGIMHDPAGFLADNLLSVDFSEGVKQRMPGLRPGQDIVFLNAMKSSDKHWFTMEPDPAVGRGGKPSYHLVPAWEKYAAHFAEHPESFPGVESFPEPLGAQLPPLKDDSHYVKGAYVPYEASERPGADSTIGHAEVPLNPDPNLPREGLVFTDAMNGCAFVATVKPGEETFTAWHYQSYSAAENLQAGADFRLGKTVTQWAGLHDYAAPLPPGHTPAATNMLRHNGQGWELVSQETHTNILDPNSPPRVSKQSTIPFEVTTQTPENLVKMTVDPYHVRAKQQLGQFQDAAHSLTKGLDQDSHYVEELAGFIKTMSRRLEAQERRVAELQEPGKTLEDVRAAVTELREAEQKNREFLDKNEAHFKELFEHATAAYPNRRPDTLISEFRKSDWIDVMRHESDARQPLPPGSADTTSVQDLNSPAPSTRSLGDDSTPVPPSAPHPTADVQQGTSTRDFGSIPSSPAPTSQPTPEAHPSATAHGTGVSEPRQPRPTEATAPASDTRAVPPRRNADSDTPPASPAPSNSRKRGRDEDDDSTPQPAPSNSRKRGRDEDGDDRPVSEPTPEPKRRRTPSYENSDAVMQDRGFRAVGAHDPLTQDLVSHLGGEAKAHPPVSPELLGKVNPHAAPVHPGEGFRVGDDLNACMENVEAYRDTHFGRPRVAGQTLHGDVEQNPGSTLWKRHDSPALFGEGAAAIPKLMETVRDGGPGSFATVLGAGKQGTGHVVALVHGQDGQLHWADLSDHRVTPADGGMPENFRPDWTVWASVADPHENNISGPHDPNFVDTYSGFTRPADAPAPEPVAAGGSGRPQPPAVETSGSLPPVGGAGGTPRAEGDRRGFGADLRTGSPTGQQGTGHAGPSTASAPHTSDQPAPGQHEQGQHEQDQQQHDDGAAPGHEPLLPPDNSAEYGLLHDPVEFLKNNPVSVSFADGVLQRTPGLQQQDVFAFVEAFERSSEHWFTLERDPNSGPDQEAYILTPAWEKYVAHDESLPKQPGEERFPKPSNGVALPVPKPDHEYIRAGYFPYKSGSMRDEANIGNTVVVRKPDPARPGDSLVFTGGMNGCGLAITDVGPDSFKVWHVQSYSALSNLGPAATFRVEHPVTDWFGIDEYINPHQSQQYAVTNVLRHGPAGWEVISQEVVKTPGNHHIGRDTTTRPLKLDPPTGEEFTRRTMVLYDSVPAEQTRRFEGNAEWLLRDVPKEDWKWDAISKEVDGLRKRLEAQAQTFASLRRPDLTVQELHKVAGILKATGKENEKAAEKSEIMMEAILRMVYKEPASGTYAFKGHVSAVVEEFKFNANAAWIDGLHGETSAYLKPTAEPTAEPTPEPAPESVPRAGFGSVPAPATDRAPVRGDDTPLGHTPEPMNPDGPTSPVEHRADADADADGAPAPQPSNPRKRGREDEENEQDGPTTAPADKRRRTPEYENSQAVMGDRGYERIAPDHPLTGELVNYLGGAPKLHPPMSNSLLQKVNPHQEPTNPAAGFRSGNDLNACLENVEAYRDTHFGRPRVSGQTVHGTVEPAPGNTLWKRHDGPALFGQGPDAVQKLMDTVQAGGPGSFATVLGIGATGTGHAVALVHDRDGTLRWADLTDRKVAAANGTMPDNFRPDWTVWASVADPHENNVSGPHDPRFMERFSTFGESAHPSDPTGTDTFGAPHQADPNAIELAPLPVHPSTPERGQFPPVGPRVPAPMDGLCLLHSIAIGTPGAAVSRSTAEQLRSTVENHFATLPRSTGRLRSSPTTATT